MAVKQGRVEAFFQRADLAADRGLGQVQRIARMGEAAGLGDGMEHPQLVPVLHRPVRRGLARTGHSAAAAVACSAMNFSTSSAAMHPVPAAVTACRYTLSCTSPAANTPGTLVTVESAAVQI